MKGMGTDEDTLIRIIVGRSEVSVFPWVNRIVIKTLPQPQLYVSFKSINSSDFLKNQKWTGCALVQQIDLETVKDMYLEKYDVTLKDALDSECGGDFKRLLIEILH